MISNILNDKEVNAFFKLIENSVSIVLTCHVRPDGDAIGSTLGFCHLLNSLGKHASVVTPDMPPRSLAFLPGFKDVVAYSKYPDFGKRLIDSADLIICCDFNKPERQDALGPVVQQAGCPKVLVDHHQFPGDFATITFSYPEMSSTCELVFRLIAAMGLYGEVSCDSATCICTGIITDTRNLSVNCNNPELYLVMLELLNKGVDKQRIVREALETKSLDSVMLRAFAISSRMEIFEQHKCAVITLSHDDLERFHYERGDSEGLVNVPLEIRGMTYSFFLREDPDCIKVSARSINNFPVSKICEDYFNGGGHLQAAGGEFEGTLEECRRILVDALPKYDKYLKRKK